MLPPELVTLDDQISTENTGIRVHFDFDRYKALLLEQGVDQQKRAISIVIAESPPIALAPLHPSGSYDPEKDLLELYLEKFLKEYRRFKGDNTELLRISNRRVNQTLLHETCHLLDRDNEEIKQLDRRFDKKATGLIMGVGGSLSGITGVITGGDMQLAAGVGLAGSFASIFLTTLYGFKNKPSERKAIDFANQLINYPQYASCIRIEAIR